MAERKASEVLRELAVAVATVPAALEVADECFGRDVDDMADIINQSDYSREQLANLLAAVGAHADRLTYLNGAYLRTIAGLAPAAKLGAEQLGGAIRGVDARVAAVADRVHREYGNATATIAAELRAKNPSVSASAIAREIRRRHDSGLLPGVRLPANDRSITEQLRKMEL